jgi:acyl-CoA reductase-like NAD-dependent aldehyde dehydrogenase
MTARLAGAEGVAQAVAAARAAASPWADAPIDERLRILDAFRRELVAAVDRCVDVVGRECDKTENDVVGEVFQIANLIRFLVKNAPSILKPRNRSSFPLLHKRAWVEYLPLGVVGIISPWNYPIVLPAAAALQALAAGNAVVQKPSEHATETGRLLLDLWTRSGGSADVWQMVEGGPDVGAALARARVDKLSFTGGIAGGKAVAAAAAENLTPVILELGGADAMLVCSDADLQRAAEGAVFGAFYNAGQSCIGVRRCFVHQSVVDRFSGEVKRQSSSLVGGRHGASVARDFGTIRTPGQLDRLRVAVDDAVGRGARLEVGAAATMQQHAPFPMVLTGVRPGMRVMEEELFAPILSIISVESMDQAVAWANDVPLGLGASVWSQDRNVARSLARRLQAGGVTINDSLVHFAAPALPFGGVKASGYGRSHGEEGLREFCATKAILESRFNLRREVHWFSSPQRHTIIRRAMGLLHPRSWVDFGRSLLGVSRRS